MKILFSHPGVGVFVQQAARALYEADYLDSYLTSFYYNPDSIIQSSLSNLSSIIKTNLSRREIKEIPLNLVKGIPYYELLRVGTSKIDKSGIVTDKLHELSINKFDSWVSAHIRDDLDAVYCYEYNSLNTLIKAKRKGLFTIYEIPSPEHNYVHNLLNNEIQEFPELENNYFDYTSSLLKERTEKRKKEFELADLIIVNSNFTKNSFENKGLNTKKIKIVPLGCPEEKKSNLSYKKSNNLKLLWAGTFSIRKGAHYLLRSMKELNDLNIILDVYGKLDIPARLLINNENINYNGSVPREKLLEIMEEYDFLIFPTLCDGFGLVITEALSNGLPVITTKNAGASDLIIDGHNGFVIESHNSDSITKKIFWCNNNKKKSFEMRKNALNSASKWQWHNYRKKLTEIIKDSIYNQ